MKCSDVTSITVAIYQFLWSLDYSATITLCRSPIHRRGLFCLRDIDAGEMVIEYTGNVIRSVLTDKREKYYESRVGISVQR